jgi:hypothetical protein
MQLPCSNGFLAKNDSLKFGLVVSGALEGIREELTRFG